MQKLRGFFLFTPRKTAENFADEQDFNCRGKESDEDEADLEMMLDTRVKCYTFVIVLTTRMSAPPMVFL